jgi:hypothetical protein
MLSQKYPVIQVWMNLKTFSDLRNLINLINLINFNRKLSKVKVEHLSLFLSKLFIRIYQIKSIQIKSKLCVIRFDFKKYCYNLKQRDSLIQIFTKYFKRLLILLTCWQYAGSWAKHVCRRALNHHSSSPKNQPECLLSATFNWVGRYFSLWGC